MTIDINVPTGETTAEVSGTVNIHGGESTQVYVQDSTDKTTWKSDASAIQVEEGESGNVPFTAIVENLEPETIYYFRVETQNGTGSVQTITPETGPYPSATTGTATPVPPVISGEKTTAVRTEEATFNAVINPRRFRTTYVFEYAPRSTIETEHWSSPNVRRSEGPSPLPADNVGHPVFLHATGLTPGEAYAWRVSAENAGGPAVGGENNFTAQGAESSPLTGCPNELFRTGFAAYLPDCRAYEQVTPVDKGGLYLEGFADLLDAADDGSGITYISAAGSGLPGAGGGARQDTTTYLSSRGEDSWSLQSLLPAQAFGDKAGFLGASANDRFVVDQAGRPDGGSIAELGLFLVDTRTDTVTQIVDYQSPQEIGGAFGADAIGDEGSYVFFESQAQLTPEAAASGNNLYEWRRETGTVDLVGVLPPSEGETMGRAPRGGSFGGSYAWNQGKFETGRGGARDSLYVEAAHAATEDGNQIYFTAAGEFESSREAGQLYLRRGLDGPDPTTVRVSAPDPGVQDPFVEEIGFDLPAAFQESTSDGTYVFFTSSQKLTADATTGEFDNGTDLYRYDTRNGSLTDITGGLGGEARPAGAEVLGLLGISSSGASGFLAAQASLAEGATPGANDVYRFAEISPDRFSFTFVSTVPGPAGEGSSCLLASGARNWATGNYCGGGAIGSYTGKTSRVTPDGQILVFTKGEDIYRYVAGAGAPSCISCGDGEPSLGEAELTTGFFNSITSFVPESLPGARLTNSVSEDGTKIFFQTPNTLLASDKNGSDCTYLNHNGGLAHPTCMDVYEWEAAGSADGSCSSPASNGGCLYLLSSGQSDEASYLLGESKNGENVFLATTTRLVSVDRDQLYDIYDARVHGGIAGQYSSPVAPCEGSSCQGPAAASAAPFPVGTSPPVGGGNVTPPPRCHRPLRRHGAKCVRKSHHRRIRHRKHAHHRKSGARSRRGDQ